MLESGEIDKLLIFQEALETEDGNLDDATSQEEAQEGSGARIKQTVEQVEMWLEELQSSFLQFKSDVL